jgi:hypothetical protein
MNSWTVSSTRAARCRLATSASGTWASAFDPGVTYKTLPYGTELLDRVLELTIDS